MEAKGKIGFRTKESTSKVVQRMYSIVSEKYPLDLGVYMPFQNLAEHLFLWGGNHSLKVKSEAIKYQLLKVQKIELGRGDGMTEIVLFLFFLSGF